MAPKGANSQADSALLDPEALTLTENDSSSEEAILDGQLPGKKSCGLDTDEENLLPRNQLETSKGLKGANSQSDSTSADPEALAVTENDSFSEEAIVNVWLAGKKSWVLSTEKKNLIQRTQLETSKELKGANSQADSTLADPEALTLIENDSLSDEAIVNGRVAGKKSCDLDTKEENLLHRTQLETSKEPKGANSQADSTLADPEALTLTENFSTSCWSEPFTCKADNELVTEKSGNVECKDSLIKGNTLSRSPLSGEGIQEKDKEPLEYDLLTLRADGESGTVSEEKMSEYHVSRCEADEVGEKALKDESLRMECEVSCAYVVGKDKSREACLSGLEKFEKGDGAVESRICRLDVEVATSTDGMQDEASMFSQSPGSGFDVCRCGMQQVEEPKILSCQVEVTLVGAATAPLEMNSRTACISKEAEVVDTLANGDLEKEKDIPYSVRRNNLLLRHLSCQTVRKATFDNFRRKRERVTSGTVSPKWGQKQARKVMGPGNSKSCISGLDDNVVNPDDCLQDTVPSSAPPTPVRDRDSLSGGRPNWGLQTDVVMLSGEGKEEVKTMARVVVLQVENGDFEKVGAADQEHLRIVGGDEEAQRTPQRAVALAGTFDEAIPMEVDTVNLDAAIDKGSQMAANTKEQHCKGDINVAGVTERCFSDGCNCDEELVDLERLTDRIYKLKAQMLGSRMEKQKKRQWVLVDKKSTHGLKRRQVKGKCREAGSGGERFTGGTSSKELQMEVAAKYPCAVGMVSMRGALKTHPTYIIARKNQQSRSRKLAHGKLKKHGQKGREVASFSGLVLQVRKMRESKKSVLKKAVAARFSSPDHAAGSEIMDESNSCKELHPGIKLLPNRKWSVKAYADGKPVWVGEYPTMGAAIYIHDVVSGACPLYRTTEPTDSRKPEEKLLPVSGSWPVENPTGIATNLRIYKDSVPNSTSTAPKLLPTNISLEQIVGKMEIPHTAELTKGSVTGEETESQGVAGVKEENNERVDHLSKENKETVPEHLSVRQEVFPVGTFEDMNVTNKEMRKFESGLKNVSARADVSEKIQDGLGGVDEGVLSHTASRRCHERLDYYLSPSDDAAMVEPLKVRTVVDLVNIGGFKTTEEQAVARQASLALWKAIYCCPQNREEEMQGLNVPDRLALLGKMYRYVEIDGSSQKVCLRSGPCGGNPCEEIYIGHYDTLTEAHAACKAISRCQKVFKKSIVVEDVGSATVTADCAPVDPALQADAKVIQVHNRDLPCVIQVPRPASETSGSHLSVSSSVVSSHIVGSLSGQYQNADKMVSEQREGIVPVHGFTSGNATSHLSISREVHTSRRGLLAGLSGPNTAEANSSEIYPRRILEDTHLASSVADKDASKKASLRDPSNDRGLLTTKSSSGASAGVWRPCIDRASHARSESVRTADGEPSFQAHAQFLQSVASNEACMQPVLAVGTHASTQYPTVISVATSSGIHLSQPLKCSSTQHIVDLECGEEALTADTTETAIPLKTTPATSTKDLVILDSDEELLIDITTGTANLLDVNPLTSTQDIVILDDDEDDLIDITTGTRNCSVANPLTSNGRASGASSRGPSASSNPGYVSLRSNPAPRTNASQAVRPSMSLQLPTTSFVKAPLCMADTSNSQVVDCKSLDALAAQMQRRSELTDSSEAQVLGNFQLQQEVTNFRDNPQKNFVSYPPHLVSDADQQQQETLGVWSQFSGRLPLDSHGTTIGFPLSMCGQGGMGGGVNSTSVPESRLAAHLQKHNNKRRVYDCCMAQRIEAVEMDYVFIKALHCDNCNWLMHSDCAIKLKRLRLRTVVHENGQIHEHVVYTCPCEKTSTITRSILARVKWMTQSLSLHRNDKTFPIDLNHFMDMLSRLKKVLAQASSRILKETHCLASKLIFDLSTSPGAINYAAVCRLLDSAVKLVAGVEPGLPRTLPSFVGVAPRR